MGPSGKGSAKQTLPINLSTSMIAWLRASTTSYDLSNESKAVRCCVNCVALGDVKFIANADFFDKNDDCQRTMDIELAMEQLEWIDTNTCSTTTATTTTTTTTTNFKNRNDVIRGVIAACMQANDKAVVFGVIRCKSKVASCDGAKIAIAKLVSNRRSNNSESNNDNTSSSDNNNNNTAY